MSGIELRIYVWYQPGAQRLTKVSPHSLIYLTSGTPKLSPALWSIPVLSENLASREEPVMWRHTVSVLLCSFSSNLRYLNISLYILQPDQHGSVTSPVPAGQRNVTNRLGHLTRFWQHDWCSSWVSSSFSLPVLDLHIHQLAKKNMSERVMQELHDFMSFFIPNP